MTLITKQTAFLFYICLLIVGCATTEKTTLLDDTLTAYAAEVRWGRFDEAVKFLDPNKQAIQPSRLDFSRYNNFKVSRYFLIDKKAINKTEVIQRVEISLINQYTGQERTIVDDQLWQFDKEAKRWWLVSGLPTLSKTK